MSGTEISRLIAPYWGKGQPLGDVPYHPAAYHSLDVTACAAVLLNRSPFLRQHVERLLGKSGMATVLFCSALHDLGKFSAGFQWVAPELRKQIWPDANDSKDRWVYNGPNREYHHDALGHAVWQSDASATLPLTRKERKAMRLLIGAACGHHGSPPNSEKARVSLHRAFSDEDIVRATEYVQAMFKLFVPDGLNVPECEETIAAASFLVASVVNMADWIGSRQPFFWYCKPTMPLTDYYRKIAIPTAERAIDRLGLMRALPVPPTQFAALFPDTKLPTPLQTLVENKPLHSGAQLWIIEDATGSGKTKAADLLAARIIANGEARSVAFCLPGITTTNAMIKQHKELLKNWCGSTATLGLAHSNARRSRTQFELDEAGADSAAWLTGDNRRVISSDFVLCTLDQVLLGVMPARFAAVRQFGLLDKVIIIDEAHAYDAYTGELMCGLLRFLGLFQRPVVILSATLPSDTKQRMCEAYAEGAGWNAEALKDHPELSNPAYPLVTEISKTGVQANQITTARHAERQTAVKITGDNQVAIQHLVKTAQSGQCCLWVRNTVDDAIEGFEQLSALHNDVTLLHSRFPEADLSPLKNCVLERFGDESNHETRRGGIVVATQIVEQSLDLDFDQLVSDLCPIDSLIQRFGRFRRHRRDIHGNRLPPGRNDERPSASAILLSPNPDNAIIKKDWYSKPFRRASWVYQNPGLLWRTAKAVKKAGAVCYPGNVRDLVEWVYGSDEMPPALEDRSIRQEGDAGSERQQGAFSTINLSLGYRIDGALYGRDERIPTRLGNSVEFVLLRREGSEIVPWKNNDWLSGSVRVSETWAINAHWNGTQDELAALDCIPELRWKKPVLVVDGQAEFLDKSGSFKAMVDGKYGLRKMTPQGKPVTAGPCAQG